MKKSGGTFHRFFMRLKLDNATWMKGLLPF